MRTRRSINWLRRGREPERGAALVEFALILPVFMALVLGMFTGGVAYNRKLSMTNAVREGARFGATLPASDASWATKVASRVEDLSSGDLDDATDICAKLIQVGTAPPLHESCPAALASLEPGNPSGTTVGQCLVKVWGARTSDLQVFFFSRTVNLRSKTVARFERPDTASPPCLA